MECFSSTGITSLRQTEYSQFIIKEINVTYAEQLPLDQLHALINSASLHYQIISDMKENIKLTYFKILLNKCAKRKTEL